MSGQDDDDAPQWLAPVYFTAVIFGSLSMAVGPKGFFLFMLALFGIPILAMLIAAYNHAATVVRKCPYPEIEREEQIKKALFYVGGAIVAILIQWVIFDGAYRLSRFISQ